MRLKDLAERTTDLFHIDPAKIEVEPGFNFRTAGPEYDLRVRKLADMIKEQGLRQPLGIQKVEDRVIVRSGHTRLAAIMLLRSEGMMIQTVQCIPEKPGTTELERVIGLYQDNDGEKPTMLETADIFARLQKLGLSNEQIAAQAGLTAKQVGNIFELRAAPQEIKEMVSAGQVSATSAIKTLQSAASPAAAAATLQTAVATAQAEGKSKATPKMISAVPTGKPMRPPAVTAPLPVTRPAPAPLRVVPAAAPAPRVNTARYQELIDTLTEITKLTDIATIHQLANDCLKE